MTLLSDLITQIRWRTNTEQSDFVTAAELASYINASLSELDDILIASSQDYKLKSLSVSMTSTSTDGYASFALPSDYLQDRYLDKQIGAGWISVPVFQPVERNRFTYPLPGMVTTGLSVRYHVVDGQVQLIPGSNASGTYRFWYVPKFNPLASSDALPAYMDTQAWCEYAVCDVAIKVNQKQDLDCSLLMAQKEALRNRIINMSTQRRASGGRAIINLDRCGCYGLGCSSCLGGF